MKTVKIPFPSKLASLRLGQEKHQFLGLGRFNVNESPSLRFLCPQSTLLLTEWCIAALTSPEDSLEIRNLGHHLRICILTRCPGDSPAHHNWRSPALKMPPWSHSLPGLLWKLPSLSLFSQHPVFSPKHSSVRHSQEQGPGGEMLSSKTLR